MSMEQQEHEKLNVKKNKIKIDIQKKMKFFVKTTPTRHIKYKVIDFAPINI